VEVTGLKPLLLRSPRASPYASTVRLADKNTAYAYEELQNKRTIHAKELFQKALESDPLNVDAAVNLGVVEAQSGNAEKALSLWKSALERAPWNPAIGLNIAQLLQPGVHRGSEDLR